MGMRPSAGGSFNWPPSRTDLEAIDVMDVSQLGPPDGLVAAGAVAVPTRHRGPVWTWVAMARTVTRADRLALLAVGVLLGTALPQVHGRGAPHPMNDATAAATAMSPEGLQLHAMRALLRGEVAPGQAAGRARSVMAPSPPPTATAADTKQAAPTTPMDAAAASARPWHGEVAGAPAHAATPVAITAAPDAAATRTPMTRATGPQLDPYTAPVHKAVRTFEAAWTRMDASATRAVWPTANPTVLARTFTGVREQRLRLSPCRIDRSGARASATCSGTLRYRPRVGEHSTRVRRDSWEFELERTNTGWVIRSVSTG